MLLNYAIIGLGGALGAMARHGMNAGITALAKTPFPYGILCVNVLGSFLIGICAGAFLSIGDPGRTMQLFIMTGFLGGFTTFSTFSLDAVVLAQRGDVAGAALYVLGSVGLSIAAVLAGMFLVWRMAA
ncbi:MAG TPA: fluoride efflux transporter CrcB [Alphaproteobacteria bacterium]|nr:fluoride efflux transporter CrcB [Alphaproteobacteria bacterium]